MVVAHDELGIGQFAEFLDALVQEVLLVELVKQREAAFEPGELAEVLQDAQADRVEGAEVHLVQVELDAQLGQPVRDAGGQFACRLVGEGDDEQRFGRDPLMLDEVDDSLNERERLTGSRPCNDEYRAFSREDGFELLGIRFTFQRWGDATHCSPPPS